jgi:exonuclease SbcC
VNPLRVRGEGYGRFDRFDVELPTGACAIVGPNGAGKSRLLNAVELALFAGRGELAQWLAPDHDRLVLELEVAHNHNDYRVRRTYQGGARGKQTVDFEVANHGDPGPKMDAEGSGIWWEPLTRETAAATDELIVETLGLSRATFGASAFLAQGNAGAFPDATAAERKLMLGEILDPHGLWPKLADRAKADAKNVEIEILTLHGQIGVREDQLATQPALAEDVANLASDEQDRRFDLAEAEKGLEAAQQQVVDNAAAAERVRALTVEWEHAQTDYRRAGSDLAAARDAAARLADSEVKLAQLEPHAARIPAVEEKLDEQKTMSAAALGAKERRLQAFNHADGLAGTASRIAQEGERLAAQHRELAERHAHLDAAGAGIERCDRCEQILGAEAREAALANMKAELDGIETAITAKAVALAEARSLADRAAKDAEAIEIPEVPVGDFAGELATLREAERWIASALPMHEQWRALAETVPAREQELQEKTGRLDTVRRQVDEARAETPAATELDRQLAEAKGAVAACRRNLDATTADLVRARQQLDQLAQAKAELVTFTAHRDTKQADLDILKLAERAFGRNGIPALIAENAIPAIEAKANEILELMPTAKGETLRVELRTQRELKSADHLKETLDILACDAHGPRTYETYSGGEKGRLNVALRLALAQLLAHRRGAESRILCLDEVEYLDQLGQEQLVEVVASVAGSYDRVLVVSHAAGVRDAFETVIEVASDQDGVSYLVGDRAKLEAVSA